MTKMDGLKQVYRADTPATLATFLCEETLSRFTNDGIKPALNWLHINLVRAFSAAMRPGHVAWDISLNGEVK